MSCLTSQAATGLFTLSIIAFVMSCESANPPSIAFDIDSFAACYSKYQETIFATYHIYHDLLRKSDDDILAVADKCNCYIISIFSNKENALKRLVMPIDVNSTINLEIVHDLAQECHESKIAFYVAVYSTGSIIYQEIFPGIPQVVVANSAENDVEIGEHTAASL